MFGWSSNARTAVRPTAPSSSTPHSLIRHFAAILRGNRIDLASASVRDLATSFHTSAGGSDYRRQAPSAIEGPSWISALIADARAAEPVAVPPSGVATIDDAIICGEGLVCRAFSTGPVVVRETLNNGRFDRSIRPVLRDGDGSLFLKKPLRPRRRLRGPHVMLRQIWDSNYGHWLVECLPRLAIVAEHRDLTDVKIIVSRNGRAMRQITRETLCAFGMRPDQIIEMPRETLEVEELIYPLPMTIHPWVKAPRAVGILEALGERIAGGATGPKRLYVSRAGARQRRLLNEADVLRMLEPYGFTVVHPETLSFAAQVRIFSGAEVIVGNYGANLANVVFAPRGVTLFALTSEAMPDDFFWDLTNLKDGRYLSLHGTAATRRIDLNSDFRIDPAALRPRLEALLGS